VKSWLPVSLCLAAVLVCTRPASAQLVVSELGSDPIGPQIGLAQIGAEIGVAQIVPAPHAVAAVKDFNLKTPAAIWAAGVVADQITTYRFTSRYRDLLHEKNVLINALDRHPVWLVVAGSALDAGTGWLAYRVLGKSHPRLAAIAFYGAAAYRTYLATHNMRMMSRAREIRAMTR
jgi:hypothetical protein